MLGFSPLSSAPISAEVPVVSGGATQIAFNTATYTSTAHDFNVNAGTKIPFSLVTYTSTAFDFNVNAGTKIPFNTATYTSTAFDFNVNAGNKIPFNVATYTSTAHDFNVNAGTRITFDTAVYTSTAHDFTITETPTSPVRDGDAVPGWHIRMVKDLPKVEELETIEEVVVPKEAPTIIVDASEEAVDALRDSLLPAPPDLSPLRIELARLEQERYAEALRQMRLRAEEEEQAVLLTLLASTRRRNRFGIRI